MKKKIISIAIILPLMLGLGFACMAVNSSAAGDISALIEASKKSAKNGEWLAAARDIDAAVARYNRVENLLRLWTAHPIVDAVKRELVALSLSLQLGDAPGILERYILLEDALADLERGDDISLINIL